MTLLGTEYTLRLSGAGAKNLAAMLIAVAQGHQQTKGKTRLKTLLDSNKEMKVFQLDADELKGFAAEAKKYGLLYTVIRPGKAKAGDMVDIMAKAEDASKISRILDKLDLGKTDVADVVSEIEAERQAAGHSAADKGVEAKDEADRIVDELLTKPISKDGADKHDPLVQETEARRPSEPTSANTAKRSEGSTSKEGGNPSTDKRDARKADKVKEGEGRTKGARRSVKAEMEEIRRERKDAPKSKQQPQQTRHSQEATRRKKTKTPNTKGR